MSDNFTEAEELNERLGDAASALRETHKHIMDMLLNPEKYDKSKNNVVPFEKREK